MILLNDYVNEEVDLWVCPRCHILQGIEVWKSDDVLYARCVNCGVPLEIDEVQYINQELAKKIIEEVELSIPSIFHPDIRYSWVSNKTLGLVFELGLSELREEVDFDIIPFFEDVLASKYSINITVFFEN